MNMRKICYVKRSSYSNGVFTTFLADDQNDEDVLTCSTSITKENIRKFFGYFKKGNMVDVTLKVFTDDYWQTIVCIKTVHISTPAKKEMP